LLVTKIQLAAMSRADVPAEAREPFYLYVDEFQNFATDSFAAILSEARKYGLNLTVANQYIAQMLPEVRDAVFGNVGSIISFRTSADDANAMLRYFEPKFTEHDMVHMHNRHFVISMTIDGEKIQAFSAISLNLPPFAEDVSQAIIDHSRTQFAITREQVERIVNERYLTMGEVKQPVVKSLPPAQPRATTIPSPQPAAAKPTPITLAHNLLDKVIDLSASPEVPPKRKRTRRRKRSKTGASVDLPSSPLPTSNVPDLQSSSTEHVIKLR
jgi:hypothetical protein